MKVDVFLSSSGEVGIVTNWVIDVTSRVIRLDPSSGQLYLSSQRDETPFNILLSPSLANHIQSSVYEVFWSVIQDGEITHVDKMPLHVDGRFNVAQLSQKSLDSAFRNFKEFLKACIEGQPIHRESFDDDSKLKSVFEGVSPSLLKASPNIQQVMKYTKDYALAPDIGYTMPAPGPSPSPGGGGTGFTLKPKPVHVNTGSDRRNPMTYFVKKRHKESFFRDETPKGDEDPFKTSLSIDEIMEPLMSLTGLHSVKKQIRDMAYLIQSKKMREDAGLTPGKISMHMIFSGSPGTGKTTVARELGLILAQLGFLDSGHVVEVQRSDLVSKWSGETEQKTRDVFMSALDGILFIDEAYSLNLDDDSNIQNGKEALTTLLKLMEDYRERVIVIAAGYTVEMQKFVESNPGLRSRFGHNIIFPNYTPEELVQIFEQTCRTSGYVTDNDTIDALRGYFARMLTSDAINAFGNARGVRNLFDKALLRQASRIVQSKTSDQQEIKTLTYDDVFIEESQQRVISKEEIEDLLRPLNELVGMQDVKRQVADFIYMMHTQTLRRKKKLPTSQLVLHSIFSGPPGTGKTTVARILGRILCKLGFLRQGHVVETDRSGLIGKWSGHTPEIVRNKFSEAEGGILFIDEAYALINDTDTYGREAVDTILKLMEDRSAGTMVICAGYPEEMDKFLKGNPGLRSRFPFHLDFTTYKAEELVLIFEKMCAKQKYHPTTEAIIKLQQFLQTLSKEDLDKNGNGRLVRNIFEKTIINQSRRLNSNFMDNDDLLTLTEEDIHLPDIKVSQRIGFF